MTDVIDQFATSTLTLEPGGKYSQSTVPEMVFSDSVDVGSSGFTC